VKVIGKYDLKGYSDGFLIHFKELKFRRSGAGSPNKIRIPLG
jgi:hypothetical protein